MWSEFLHLNAVILSFVLVRLRTGEAAKLPIVQPPIVGSMEDEVVVPRYLSGPGFVLVLLIKQSGVPLYVVASLL